MKKKALVTGGAGFIGSHLSHRLLASDWDVHIVDNLSTGFLKNVPEEATFCEVDLSEADCIERLPNERFDAVFHLAAQSSGEISFDDPAYDLKTNCLSTVLLCDWCLKNGTPRFLYTSSMSIYGDQEIQPVKESAIPKPKSFYGVGKLASEAYLQIYESMGLSTTSLRLFNVYGPGQNLENMRQGMVSIYLSYILRGQELVVKGSPDRHRDLVFIGDVIDAYLACLDNPQTHGKSYNVGTGYKTTVGQLVDAELAAFGHTRESYPVRFVEGTPGDTFGIQSDSTLMQIDTGWSPKVDLAKGLERMVAWAKDLVAQKHSF